MITYVLHKICKLTVGTKRLNKQHISYFLQKLTFSISGEKRFGPAPPPPRPPNNPANGFCSLLPPPAARCCCCGPALEPHGFGRASAFSTPARWLREAKKIKIKFGNTLFECTNILISVSRSKWIPSQRTNGAVQQRLLNILIETLKCGLASGNALQVTNRLVMISEIKIAVENKRSNT